MFQAATSDFVRPIVPAFLPKNIMRTPFGYLGLLFLLVFVDSKPLWAVEFDVIVEGGGFSRSHSVASFDCPHSIWDPELDQEIFKRRPALFLEPTRIFEPRPRSLYEKRTSGLL